MFLYRLLLTLAAPVLALRILRRDQGAALDERLGGAGDGIVHGGAVLWVHAASNGELAAARGLIDALLAADHKLRLVLTCNTATGRNLARGWALPRTDVRLAPLDYALLVRRFIGNWQPDALIIVENELWPNRMAEMHRRGRPVIVVSARMSARSLKIWQRLPGIARRVVGAISHLSAQDTTSEARFAELGLPRHRIGPVLNLKTGAADPAQVDDDQLDRLYPFFPYEKTILAASTHEGEEASVLMGFRKALGNDPDLRLILAPRHPHRSSDIQALLKRQGLGFALRSAGEGPQMDTPVYLADTLGEMPLWYELAGTTFVGGSLVAKGGHTPFEPAAHGSALLYGPHVENFQTIYAVLHREGAAIKVSGADDISAQILAMTPERRATLAQTAAKVMARLQEGAGMAPLMAALADLTGNPALRPDESDKT